MPDEPNVLVIITDQQRFDSLRCYGNDWVQTPNLDALADTSFVFENAYVTQPVCTPARSSLLTGLYPHTTGQVRNAIPMRDDTSTIAELAPSDYHCAYFGKWHLGNDTSAQHGFAEWVPVGKDAADASTSRSYEAFLERNGVELPPAHVRPGGDGAASERAVARANLPEHLTQAAWVSNEAIDFFGRQSGPPFLLFVNFFEPHPPYSGPLGDLYGPEDLPVGPAFLKQPVGASLFNTARAEFYLAGDHREDSVAGCDGHDLHTEAGWRALRAQYFANITLVDRQVGRMIAALDEAGLMDDTIIVVTSDHGEMLGDHGLLEKRAFYEESARVPFILRVPALSKEQTSVPGNFGHIDLVPTLLELMGAEPPDHLQGESGAAVLRGEATLESNDVFIEWNGQGDRDLGNDVINEMIAIPRRAIVSPDRWKLVLCEGDDGELFDLNSDPHELTNLFRSPEQQARISDLTERLRAWQARTGDTAPLGPA